MSNTDGKAQLSPREYFNIVRDVAIRTGIEAIPYVGNPLAALYFDTKQQRQFKRLEKFYSTTAKELEKFKDKIALTEAHDKESLVAIIEELNEKVEREQSKEKLEFLKNYLKNSLFNPVKENNFDERRFFLNSLSTMTLLECELLSNLYKQVEFIEIDSIEKPGVDKHAIAGSIGTLKNYGFLEPKSIPGWADFPSGVVGSTVEKIKISSFGKKFCEFCLQTPL
jgi:hypothetical protein